MTNQVQLYLKAESVIASCENHEHLRVAVKYVELLLPKIAGEWKLHITANLKTKKRELE